MTNDTICAISTPQGTGGIAVIRISGENAITIADQLFYAPNGQHILSTLTANKAQYGQIKRADQTLDEVVATIFRAPHSYTGEDIVEIACHGSIYIQHTLLQWFIDCGCRLANHGEFTQRAFLNGKMDLTQAEAVADLIASENQAAHQIAIKQIKGGIRNEIQQLRDKLLHFTSLIELELDFADHEDLTFADRTELKQLISNIKQRLTQLTDSFQQGNAIKNGIPVAIIGPTNAGKSTLLNQLLHEDKAIVSDIHGTTRDIIEDTITINNLLFRFIDTAGIRHTQDTIENIGIERALQAAQKATIVLIMLDATIPLEVFQKTLEELKTEIGDAKQIILINKTDLIEQTKKEQIELQLQNITHLFISAKSAQGIDKLQQLLINNSQINQDYQHATISNLRHYEALKRALQAITQVEQGLNDQLSGELLSLDLNDCLKALAEITGEISSQEVLNNIFSHFCIGK